MSNGRRGARSGLDRRVSEALTATGLACGSSVTAVLTAVADHRGRPVQVSPLPAARTAHPYGSLLHYPDRDDVLYRTGDTADELHNVLHLCAHLLLDHVESRCADVALRDLAELFPDLAPALLTRALAPTSAVHTAEAEAEAFVSALHGSIAA